MTKKILVILIVIGTLNNCSDDDTCIANEQSSALVVDKIFDYNYNLLAEYFYNENNQLIKRERIDDGVLVSEYEFEYVDNRISKIEYLDHNYPQFNHTIFIFYNQQGQIIRDETHQYENIISINDYTYNANGRIQEISRFSEGFNTTHTYIYNNTENVEQVVSLIPEFDEGGTPTGNFIETSFGYDYDNGLKPDFGIGKVFQIEPLPAFGAEAVFEKNSSQNNMIKNLSTGTQWLYTYNENDQVETIETIWDGIETEEPILLRLEYKEVN